MSSHEQFYTDIYETITYGVERGLLHLNQNKALTKDNKIHIGDKTLFNFTSCSYLGLEHDARLKSAAIEAINQYGTQFSESRAYVSIGLYQELEVLMEEIFDAPAIIAPTTTLAHLATIPVVLDSGDAIIVDQQLHNSVLSGINVFRANWPVHFEVLRHNRIDILEERVNALKTSYNRVWYFCDGIYSMFGDRCPIEEIEKLLNLFPTFHTYIDDAHAMSILGEKGKGFVLGSRKIHEKMIVASSMAKAFATGGGILIFPNKALAKKVRTCGAPFNSSGPLQPATLGAAVASAKIHLTREILGLQEELTKRIRYANSLFIQTSLPVISNYDSAIFFIGTSKAEVAFEIMEKMMKRGFLVNIGVFPAVSKKHAGIRFTITNLQTLQQINNMIGVLNEEFMKVINNRGISVEDINNAFKTIASFEKRKTGILL